ncbi:glutathione synthase [Sansalvadorimonas verongulae]|uniref:glutathione synthase n=1 Tax=Sansalvadorimonas verongulae TaxID=2172824 RepID=UPI0012BB9E77|nr:glutathione synthase [Sansalvadorimonas verongulae]MTI15196.1 glutathione synthase [Sansalvadorimonas verongulae]
MTAIPQNPAIQGAVEWALLHGFSLKTAPGSASHCAFSLTPTTIDTARFEHLKETVPLAGKLLHKVSEDHAFLQKAMAPVAGGDAFFDHLVQLHKKIHWGDEPARRIPMLFMRTDFMDDAEHGPRLIEFNGIAAGMGPFGQRAHEMHGYLQNQFATDFHHWSPVSSSAEEPLKLVDNPAIEQLAKGVAESARAVRQSFNESGKPVFLMIVQHDEDNVYDQHLLEEGIQAQGVRTVRRTFRELYDQLSTGDDHRLLLKDIGSVDCIYLRAGYQYSDYIADDLIEPRCCDALVYTRVFMEKHHVAINATVSQQLATSKRVQMLLTGMSDEELSQFGLTKDEAIQIKSILGDMRPVSSTSTRWFKEQNPQDWVLKNQGEGGGHCVFGNDILPKLKSLTVAEYSAWSLMRRLHPAPRTQPALLVRKGQPMIVNDLISEIGMFTVHLDGRPVTDFNGYAGYLIRSKPASVSEGGVHSGLGAADSLAFTPDS